MSDEGTKNSEDTSDVNSVPLEEATKDSSDGTEKTVQDDQKSEKLFTQKELNEKIQDRLARVKDKHAGDIDTVKQQMEEQFSEQLQDLQSKVDEYESKISDLNQLVLRAKISEKTGVPINILENFKANSEEELLQAVQSLKKYYPSGGQRLRPQLSEGYVPDAMSEGKKASVLRGLINNNQSSKRIL